MIKLKSPGQYRIAIQICAASAVAALLSGCSSDAFRFNDPFSSPFTTGSVAKPKHVASARITGTGKSPPVVAQALPPRPTSVASAVPARPAATVASAETTGSIGPVHAVPGASSGGWSSSGGASVTVAQGENAEVLAKRYGVPQNVLLQVNGLRSAGDLQPGVRITVPIYNAVATAGSASTPARVAALPHALASHPAPARVAAAAPEVEPAPVRPAPHAAPKPVVAPAKLAKLKPKPKAAAPARVAAAVSARDAKPARVAAAAPAKTDAAIHSKIAAAPAHPKTATVAAQTLKGAALVKTAAIEPPAKVKAGSVQVAAPPQPVKLAAVKAAPARVAPAPKAEPAAEAEPRAADPAPTASVAPPAPATEASNGPEFRWPARGRIIQSFKGGSGGNDGINIAVPEGTAVKAAEGGVVAYAGSELKGYGNMVLIRHPNGFVTAYANNAEIAVKKGDTVKRGQLIAKSGQTGNVASPQLHFELRKGAQPVDPTSYLAGL